MIEKVFLFFSALLSGAFAPYGIVITTVGVFLISMLNIFLSVFIRNYGEKQKILTLLVSVVFCALPLVFLTEKQGVAFLFFLIVACFINSFAFFIKTKGREEKKSEVVKSTLGAIKDVKPLVEKIKEVEKIEPSKDTENYVKKSKTDFTHVKNVIERLRAFPLSSGDRKQVKELEDTIILIENGTGDDYGINDGLGALLKIMAKYGV